MDGYNGHKGMDRIINFLGQKPEVGSVTSFSGLIGSIIIKPEIQDMVLFALQALVLITSLTVGILTIIGWCRKQKKTKNNESS
jgi:hypothetical protein